MHNLNQLFWVMMGGALGAGLRFAISLMLVTPLSTVFVNRLELPSMVAFVVPGFLGGFTTFSTFGWDTMRILQLGEISKAIGYVALSVVGGLVFSYLGSRI